MKAIEQCTAACCTSHAGDIDFCVCRSKSKHVMFTKWSMHYANIELTICLWSSFLTKAEEVIELVQKCCQSRWLQFRLMLTFGFYKLIVNRVTWISQEFFLTLCKQKRTPTANISPQNIKLTARIVLLLSAKAGYMYSEILQPALEDCRLTSQIIKITPLKSLHKHKQNCWNLSGSVVSERKLRQYFDVCLNYRGGAWNHIASIAGLNSPPKTTGLPFKRLTHGWKKLAKNC